MRPHRTAIQNWHLLSLWLDEFKHVINIKLFLNGHIKILYIRYLPFYFQLSADDFSTSIVFNKCTLLILLAQWKWLTFISSAVGWKLLIALGWAIIYTVSIDCVYRLNKMIRSETISVIDVRRIYGFCWWMNESIFVWIFSGIAFSLHNSSCWVARNHEFKPNKQDAFSRCAHGRVQELNEEDRGPLVSLHESHQVKETTV